MLHMEIIRERLEGIQSNRYCHRCPTLVFTAILPGDGVIIVDNPIEMPDPHLTGAASRNPSSVHRSSPNPEYIGNIMTLCLGNGGKLLNRSYLTTTRVELMFELLLTEIVFDFL